MYESICFFSEQDIKTYHKQYEKYDLEYKFRYSSGLAGGYASLKEMMEEHTPSHPFRHRMDQYEQFRKSQENTRDHSDNQRCEVASCSR